MKTKIRGIEAFPCQWPESWPQTPANRRVEKPRCKVSFSQARDKVVDSLRLMGAREVVISTDVPLRNDGLPGSATSSASPRAAVYWTDRDRKPRVIACDCWATVRENLRSIGLALEGLRAVKRAGVSSILERAYQGFAALPASAGGHAARPWYEVLEIAEATVNGRPAGAAGAVGLRALVENRFRSLARVRHPDTGGSHEAMLELNSARDEALRELAS